MKKLFWRLARPGLVLALSATVLTAAACSSSATSSSPSTLAPTTTVTTGTSSTSIGGTPSGAPGSNSNYGQRPGGGVSGTLENIDGDTLTLTTQNGTATVTVNDQTTIEKTVTGSSSDLATGKFIEITGTTDSNGNITASTITVRNSVQATPTMPGSPAPTRPSGTASQPTGTPPGGSPPAVQRTSQNQSFRVMGTISTVNGNTLTVKSMRGDVTVTTDSSTVILKIVTGSISGLVDGQSLMVMGSQDTNGNITANNIIIRSN